MRANVTTQAELDAAITADKSDIIINSPAGVWLEVGGSASVWAYGSASVRAYDSASVRAYDSASVRASGSASVWAYGSASVWAYGSASVWAYGSASVRAYDSASVRAYDYVAVHLHSARATVKGGHVIDVTALDLADPEVFTAYTGGPLLVADDGRGYRLTFRAGHYEAGCRVFTYAEAVAHWSNPEHPATESAALLLAAVEAHHGARP